MNKKQLKTLKKFGWITLFVAMILVIPSLGFAQDSLGGGWDKYLQNVLPSFATNSSTSGEELAIQLVKRLVGSFRMLIGIVALILGIIFGMQMVFSQGKEETLSKVKTNILWLFLGFLILMIAENIANIFNPETATAEALINFNDANDQLRQIANYVSWLFGSLLVLLMTISGIRMISAQGNEETIKKEKTHLVWSGIGMLVVLLARNLISAFYVINAPDDIVAGSASQTTVEIASLIRLLLAFLAPVAVIFTIYAGFLYVTSFGNDDQVSKAKRMILGGATGIIIIYAAFAITNTFISANLIPTP